MWASAQANVAALDACQGPHDFLDITPEKPIGKRYRCSLCRGEVDAHAERWYRQGIEHAHAAPKI
jgi:hypothetical protein